MLHSDVLCCVLYFIENVDQAWRWINYLKSAHEKDCNFVRYVDTIRNDACLVSYCILHVCVCVFDVCGALSFSCSTGNWRKRAMLIERPVTDYLSQLRSKCFNTIWVPKISCSCHVQNVDIEEKTIIELKQMSIHQKRGKKPLFFRFIFPCVSFFPVVLVWVIRKFCWPHSKFQFKNEHCMFQQISFQNQKLTESTRFAWNKMEKENSQNDIHHALFTSSLTNMFTGKNEWNSWSEKRISYFFSLWVSCDETIDAILSSNNFYSFYYSCDGPFCELCIKASSHHFHHKCSQRIAHNGADALNSNYGSAHGIG